MKYCVYISTIILYLSFSLVCYGQSLLPDKESNPSWNVRFVIGSPFFVEYFTYTYGDSITVCDTTWLEIKERAAATCESNTRGYVREVGQQVWMKVDTICDTPAYLIYDFSLEPGDTFWMPSFYYSNTPFPHEFIVIARDTIENGNIRLFLFETATGSVEEWLTGFGSVGDVFRLFPRCFLGQSCEFSTDVRCFQLNNVPVDIPTFFYSNDNACEQYSFTPEVTAIVQAASGENQNDGSITLTSIEGIEQPYEILWSTGDTTSTIENLFPETYTLIISDTLGCTYETTFVVSFTNAIPETKLSRLTWEFYPNPVSSGQEGLLSLYNLPKGNHTISIYNSLGQIIATSSITTNDSQQHEFRYKIPNQITPGIYWLSISNDIEHRLLTPFIIE
ncbi:MAG: T9SS type A sorting domain-containing protein [Saprospiraceae bacterium]